mmetsp:Transcript_13303/g.36326  ORF Transcript_13303/g.36326 Transcript_13303/m.36326 type:complete len:254 (+) Transcript_13303:1740-2501(+)|eukprot:scaffold135850_cov33-Tisochrysis_lutea.AAC.2
MRAPTAAAPKLSAAAGSSARWATASATLATSGTLGGGAGVPSAASGSSAKIRSRGAEAPDANSSWRPCSLCPEIATSEAVLARSSAIATASVLDDCSTGARIPSKATARSIRPKLTQVLRNTASYMHWPSMSRQCERSRIVSSDSSVAGGATSSSKWSIFSLRSWMRPRVEPTHDAIAKAACDCRAGERRFGEPVISKSGGRARCRIRAQPSGREAIAASATHAWRAASARIDGSPASLHSASSPGPGCKRDK